MPETDQLINAPATPATENLLIAYVVGVENLDLVPATHDRIWMDQTTERFAYRCLPMLLANQFGWFLVNQREIDVFWNGGTHKDDLQVTAHPGGVGHCPAVSLFGHGIVTWHMPYLFRTPPGVNLLARGPANYPREDAYPLEGLVETDWAVATFTMNWKILRPNVPVRFSVGEPVCMIVPQRRGYLESFHPCIQSIDSAPSERDRYKLWARSRDSFISGISKRAARRPGAPTWQKHYFKGTAPDGSAASEHTVRVDLSPFKAGRAANSKPRPASKSPKRAGKQTQRRQAALKLCYFICTAPRTGSYLLSEALESTGVAGRPAEYFDPHPALEAKVRRNLGARNDSFSDFVQKVLKKGRTDNGVFGCKSHWHQFQHFLNQINPSMPLTATAAQSLLPMIFPNTRYIWLKRRDTIRQVVSYARAVQSKTWWKIKGSPQSSRGQPEYDVKLIEARLRDIEFCEAGWSAFFRDINVDPLVIWYEDFCDQYEETIRRVLAYLNLRLPKGFAFPAPRLEKQADEISETWIRKYRRHLAKKPQS